MLLLTFKKRVYQLGTVSNVSEDVTDCYCRKERPLVYWEKALREALSLHFKVKKGLLVREDCQVKRVVEGMLGNMDHKWSTSKNG